MKLQIDTKAKTIKVDETIKFEELIKVLNKLLPKEWKSYSLETNSFITWYNPVSWTWRDPWVVPHYPSPIVTYSTGTKLPPLPEVTCSVYNVEVMN
jgi:hypothetical protein